MTTSVSATAQTRSLLASLQSSSAFPLSLYQKSVSPPPFFNEIVFGRTSQMAFESVASFIFYIYRNEEELRTDMLRKETNNLLRISVFDRLSQLTLRRLIYIYMEHPFMMFLDHTQRRSTVGRTPLDE